ncbi:MAG: single-stranded DNA-binding protein [Bacteroidetes bacterium]|uniref:Single-stranded DNA-binding protein n=1 Tax=Candidatus Cryptobacteroides merdigallinarum TaxID=2840770 RepID=A0A9D9EKW7_9BACT|nr:single-stranded DNA-binding protein [Candidatus Cryptobacteroides merdigallinarum]
MECINRVELAGTVGACRLTQAGGQTVARMSVATTIVYGDSAGKQVMETTWHNVVAWQKPGMADLGKISRGSAVHITGRLHYSKYTRSDGAEVLVCEILADTLQVTEMQDALDSLRS